MPIVVEARREVGAHYRPSYPSDPRDPDKAQERYDNIQEGEVLVLPDDYDKPIRQDYFRKLRFDELDGANDQLKALQGIGPAKQDKLHDAGIETVVDLATAELGDLPEDIETDRIEQAKAYLVPGSA